MVALVIAALAMAGISASISQMADAAITMQQRTYANWIGMNRITEMRLTNTVPEVSETSGELTYANQEWTWTATVSETGVENLFRVDVAVALAESGEQVRTVTGFIGEPVRPGIANAAWSNAGVAPGDDDEPVPDGDTQ